VAAEDSHDGELPHRIRAAPLTVDLFRLMGSVFS